MSEAPSVRDSLTSAMTALSEPVDRVETSPVVAGDGGTKVIEPADIVLDSEAQLAGQPRDATGKFAPKTTDTPAEAGAVDPATPPADTTNIETAKPEEKGPQPEATRIPPSLSAAVKAQWGDLPPVVRDEFSRLEESFQKGKAEWAPKGQRLNRFEEILGPRVDQWRLAGLDEFSGIQALLAAQDILERDPVGGLTHIARSYGVDLRALAGQAVQQRPGAEGQQAPTADLGLQTALQPVLQQVQALQRELQQSKQFSEQQKVADAHAEVTAFATDPAHMYFDNVREDVAARLQSGRAQSLADAYDQAIWASTEIRPHLLADQAKSSQAAAQVKAQEQAARTKAQTAQHAAGSVTGAPAPGAQAPAGPVGSIRDTLQAAAREVGWNV